MFYVFLSFIFITWKFSFSWSFKFFLFKRFLANRISFGLIHFTFIHFHVVTKNKCSTMFTNTHTHEHTLLYAYTISIHLPNGLLKPSRKNAQQKHGVFKYYQRCIPSIRRYPFCSSILSILNSLSPLCIIIACHFKTPCGTELETDQ